MLPLLIVLEFYIFSIIRNGVHFHVKLNQKLWYDRMVRHSSSWSQNTTLLKICLHMYIQFEADSRQIKCLTCDRQKLWQTYGYGYTNTAPNMSVRDSKVKAYMFIQWLRCWPNKCLCLNKLASSDHVELLTTTSLLLSPFTGLDGSLPSELHHGYFLWAQIWLRLEHAKYSENYRGTKELGFVTFRYLILFYDSLTPTPLQLEFTGLRPSPHYQ